MLHPISLVVKKTQLWLLSYFVVYIFAIFSISTVLELYTGQLSLVVRVHTILTYIPGLIALLAYWYFTSVLKIVAAF